MLDAYDYDYDSLSVKAALGGCSDADADADADELFLVKAAWDRHSMMMNADECLCFFVCEGRLGPSQRCLMKMKTEEVTECVYTKYNVSESGKGERKQ
jgi:hypothetical protein